MTNKYARNHCAKNQVGLCSSVSIQTLKNLQEVTKCTNSTNTITYILDATAKQTILDRLKDVCLAIGCYSISDVKWVGEMRTGMKDGSIIDFGYRKCCFPVEDEEF